MSLLDNSTRKTYLEIRNEIVEFLKEVSRSLESGVSQQFYTDESGLIGKVSRTADLLSANAMQVALVGGFSEGKTSIAAAWLGRLDVSMKISQSESSDSIAVYKVDDSINLVDTPGLFGFKEKYNSETHKVDEYRKIANRFVSESHLLLYVLNPENPIKDSHKEELKWLFVTLGLLPRTVFVLSKFDEVCDIEDEELYQNSLRVKTENVKNRLCYLIELDVNQVDAIDVIAVSADPFGLGFDHWLNELDTFRKMSRIDLLQSATNAKIKSVGGLNEIGRMAVQSVLSDLFSSVLPLAKKFALETDRELTVVANMVPSLTSQLSEIKMKSTETRRLLKELVGEYIDSLIVKAKGLSLETFRTFIDRDIGEDGEKVLQRVSHEIEQHFSVVGGELMRLQVTIDTDVSFYDGSMIDMGKKGVELLKNSNVVSTSNIIMARDATVSLTKMVGIDVSRFLKFKPWGATKLVGNLAAALAIVGVALEAIDYLERQNRERQLIEAVDEIVQSLRSIKKSVVELLDEDDFIEKVFPLYSELNKQVIDISAKLSSLRDKKESIDSWMSSLIQLNSRFQESFCLV